MWDPYVASTKEHLPDADSKIVFDKFHIAKHLSEAVDQVRRQENKQLCSEGDDRSVGTKYDCGQLRGRCLAKIQIFAGKHLKDGTRMGVEGNGDDAVHVSLHGFGAIFLPAMVRLGFTVPADTDD